MKLPLSTATTSRSFGSVAGDLARQLLDAARDRRSRRKEPGRAACQPRRSDLHSLSAPGRDGRSARPRRERNGPAPAGLPLGGDASRARKRQRSRRRQCLARRLVRPACTVHGPSAARAPSVARAGTARRRVRDGSAISPSTTRSCVRAVDDEFRAHAPELEAERVHRQLDARHRAPAVAGAAAHDPLAAADGAADEPTRSASDAPAPSAPRQAAPAPRAGSGGSRSRRRAEAGPALGLGSRALGLDRERLVGRRPGVRRCSRQGVELLASRRALPRSAPARRRRTRCSRQAAQRTMRPSAPICAGSIMYSLAQDGQTMSMANQTGRPAFREPRVMRIPRAAWLTAA